MYTVYNIILNIKYNNKNNESCANKVVNACNSIPTTNRSTFLKIHLIYFVFEFWSHDIIYEFWFKVLYEVYDTNRL